MAAIIENIRTWIKNCPLLKDGAIIGVDRLGADAVGYTVDTVPCSPVSRQYIDGSQIRQFLFVFASQESYGRIAQNLENSEFYDNFADWILSQNRKKNFPDLGEFREVQKIEITTSGYAYSTGDSTARYQIQLRMIYYQDRRYM